MNLTRKVAEKILKHNPNLQQLLRPEPVKVLIVVEGGAVQEVIADRKGVLVCVKDWDNIKHCQEPGEILVPIWERPRIRRGRGIDREAAAGLK